MELIEYKHGDYFGRNGISHVDTRTYRDDDALVVNTSTWYMNGLVVSHTRRIDGSGHDVDEVSYLESGHGDHAIPISKEKAHKLMLEIQHKGKQK